MTQEAIIRSTVPSDNELLMLGGDQRRRRQLLSLYCHILEYLSHRILPRVGMKMAKFTNSFSDANFKVRGSPCFNHMVYCILC